MIICVSLTRHYDNKREDVSLEVAFTYSVQERDVWGMYKLHDLSTFLCLPSIMVVQYTVLALLAIQGAVPIPFDRTTSESQQLATTTAMTAASARRTLLNIAWNCISTTILWAWVSVHPNVPPSGHWRALRRRLKTMFWTIIAPELDLGLGGQAVVCGMGN